MPEPSRALWEARARSRCWMLALTLAASLLASGNLAGASVGPLEVSLPSDWTTTPAPPGCLLRLVERPDDPTAASLVVAAPPSTLTLTAANWFDQQVQAIEEAIPAITWHRREANGNQAVVELEVVIAAVRYRQLIGLWFVDERASAPVIALVQQAPSQRWDNVATAFAARLEAATLNAAQP